MITLQAVKALLPGAVLLPIQRGEKGPRIQKWQEVTLEGTKSAAYQASLHSYSNTGVLLGPPSGDLIAIDFDSDQTAKEFFALNPELRRGTLVTRGARGCQVWLQMIGDYPREVIPAEHGEWRGGGCQSVVRGIHPNGDEYQWLCNKPPKKVSFSELKLPGWLADAIAAKRPLAQESLTNNAANGATNGAASDSPVVRYIKANTLAVCERYLPNGRKEGHEWLVGDLTGNAGRSCKIELIGEKAGLAHDWDGDEGAGLLEVIANALGIDKAKAAKRIEEDFAIDRDVSLGEAPSFAESVPGPEEAKQIGSYSDNGSGLADTTRPALKEAGQRVKIQMPGDDLLVSQFAEELGAVYRNNLRFLNRHGVCVHVRLDDQTQTHRLAMVTPHEFCTLIEDHCTPYYRREWENRQGKKGARDIYRTIAVEVARKTLVCRDFLDQLAPVLALNTVRLPILRRNETIELLPTGYDAESAILTHEEVTFADNWELHKATRFLRSLYGEFCFHQDDSERSLAVAIAGGLTLFCAHLLPKGATRPNFMFTANAEGSGKTLLAKLAALPLLGRMPTGSYPQDEAEMRKLILATVLTGSSVLFIDNLKGHLSSGSLEALTTSPVIKDRILGQSAVIEAEHGITVFITGNDATISPDLRRRTLLVELFLNQARAEDRVIERPMDDHIIDQARPDILSAYWGLLRAWDQAKRPEGSVQHPSFHPWSRIIGGILEHAGFTNPCT